MDIFNLCKNPSPSPKSKVMNPLPSDLDHKKQVPPPPVHSKNNTKKTIKAGQFIIECQCLNQTALTQSVIKNAQTNKIVYSGTLLNGKRQGYGQQFDQEGDRVFEGEYSNNMKNGWGITKKYSGQFKQDQRNGYGRFIQMNQFYQGLFLDDKYYGMGVHLKSKQGGFKYFQKIKKIQKMDQFILQKLEKAPKEIFNLYNIQEAYIGQWIDGYKNGHGKLWKQNNHWYSGQFSHGIQHGNGTQHSTDNKIQRGLFRKGVFLS